MPMIVKPTSDFESAPPKPSAAVCIDVVDLGTRETQFGARTQVRVVWSLEKRMKPKDRRQLAKPYIVQKTYTRSLHKKATLRVDLEAWRGKAFDDQTLAKGFDLETVIGKAVFLSIQQKEREGTTYANVVALMPLPSGMQAPIPDPEYVRQQDRKEDRGRPARRQTPTEDPAPGWRMDPQPTNEPEEIPGESYEEGEVADDADIPF